MKPLNVYRVDADQAVWDQAERDAAASDVSLSAYLASALRRIQQSPRGDDYVRDYLTKNVAGLTADQLDVLTGLIVELANERNERISRVEVAGARTPMNTIAYPNGRVEIDATGNLVAVEFDERVIAE